MSRRIEVELTSQRDDGTWTWRAAGAKQPKGSLDGTLLYDGASVGDVCRADADFEIDGIFVTSVLPPRDEVVDLTMNVSNSLVAKKRSLVLLLNLHARGDQTDVRVAANATTKVRNEITPITARNQKTEATKKANDANINQRQILPRSPRRRNSNLVACTGRPSLKPFQKNSASSLIRYLAAASLRSARR